MGISTADLVGCQGSSLLGACSVPTLLELMTSSHAIYDRFPAGSVVYAPTNFQRCLGILLEGQLQVTKGGLSVSVLEPGDVFGAAALFSDRSEFENTITANRIADVCFCPRSW